MKVSDIGRYVRRMLPRVQDTYFLISSMLGGPAYGKMLLYMGLGSYYSLTEVHQRTIEIKASIEYYIAPIITSETAQTGR